jgi:Tfp pilus assembly protein PilN
MADSSGGDGGGARSSRIVAALQESRGRWRVVVAQGSPARVLEARTLAPGATRELDEMLRRLRVWRLVRLVPGPRTMARCVSIPQTGPAEAAAALGLIAEAELPETIPPHRRAAGVIPDLLRPGAQTGLLTGWPIREADPPNPPVTHAAPETWATEAAALAALRGDGGVAVFADAEQGSISLLASGPARTVARVLVEDNSTPEVWARSVRRAIAETCRTAGIEKDPGLATDSVLMLSGPALAVLAGPSGGNAAKAGWLDDYGLPLGAAMLALSENPAQRSLTEMTAEARSERRGAPERVAAWLTVRRNAWTTVGVSLAVLLLLPLGLAWARSAVLDAKVAALHAQEGSREELDRSAALYDTLQKTRWPMTKLLADISGALPIGVRVESVRLSPDQGLGLEATADSAEAVTTLQQNLNKTGIFRDVRIARADTGVGGAVTFEVDAAVASPFLNAPPAEDFAAQPLAVRLYGDGASNTNWSADSDKATSSRPNRPDRPARAEGDAASGNKAGADGPSQPSRPSGSGKDDVPEPLTDDQITAMDFGTTIKAWSARKKAVSANKSLDQATKDRLASEITKLEVHRDAEKAKMSTK